MTDTQPRHVHGRRLGLALCEALGIDSHNVVSITVRADVHDAALITIERLMDADNDLATTLTEYELIERDG